MRRTMKKYVLGAVILLAMVFCANLPVVRAEAAGPRDGEVVDGSLLTSDLEATDRFEIVQRGAFLSMGVSAISNRGNGLIYIGGETFCFRTSDKVKVYLYLERLVGDAWEPVLQKPATESNTYYARNGVYLTVDKGSYYRVRGTHTAILENESESCYTLTAGIYIE